MPRDQTKTDVQRNGRQSSVLKSLANEEKRPRGIEHKQLLKPVRKSIRLQQLQCKTSERTPPLPSPSASNSFGEKIPRGSPALEKAPNPDRKRKRSHKTNYPTPEVQEEHTKKRARTSVASDTCNKTGNPIHHWIQEGGWPKEYFEQEINMSSAFARKKSTAALRREALEASSITSSQKTDGKSAPYKDLAYEILLAEQGNFLDEFHQGITDSSKDKCQILLNTEQAVPQDSLFRDDLFKEACAKLRDRNEARVINDIARLIVPSAETLAIWCHLSEAFNRRYE
ncbi:MAG: hypothetical protein MMC33_006973 [Icmadophila ericetorum]|nr:hypothetical protein [Icmadophila ericetorum]